MATSLDSISGIGANARKLAKLLQAKAPEGHMLAYINPREAALLKAHGGSGKPEPETGILSFEEEGGDYGGIAAGGGDYYGPDVTTTTERDATAARDASSITGQLGYDTGSYGLQPRATSAGQGLTAPESFISPEISVPTSPRYGVEPSKALSEFGGEAEKESIAKQLSKLTGMKEETLGRLGIAGIQGLLGARASSRAAKQGQQGKAEIQALAAPYQQKGQELQAQAQRGELTPQAMQSLEAARAQAAQGAERRGGVGAAQAQMQIEQLRQNLLQQQYDYGLKLSGIGDNISLGAIKSGLEADRFVQQLSNTYMNNILRTVAQTPEYPGTAPRPPQA